jgi:hypothetical protein
MKKAKKLFYAIYYASKYTTFYNIEENHLNYSRI